MKLTNKLLLLVLFLLVSRYAVPQKLSKTDVGAMYSEYTFTRMEPVIYHTSDDVSTVYMNISLHHFSYLPNTEGKQEANFSVAYSLYATYNDRSPLESETKIYRDDQFAGQEMQMAVDFDVKAARPGTCILKVELTDLNNPENKVVKVVDVNKQDRFSAQNFFLADEEGYPLFDRFVLPGSTFSIRYNDAGVQQLDIRYYNHEFPIAKPPFAMDKNVTYTFEPDSFYTVALTGGVSDLLELPYAGIYFIQAGTATREGLTLFRFDEGFPEVNLPAMALAPLRYLTTEREFEKLLSYRDYKVAVDSFWLERASYDPGRAKNMIRKFYQRVVDVNHLFSSYQEGWKTDRGLVYIIYGPPSEVYRSEGEEEWIYGERSNPMSIRFYFSQVDNPFTRNDFSLQRSPIYKTSWYIAVENWRR